MLHTAAPYCDGLFGVPQRRCLVMQQRANTLGKYTTQFAARTAVHAYAHPYEIFQRPCNHLHRPAARVHLHARYSSELHHLHRQTYFSRYRLSVSPLNVALSDNPVEYRQVRPARNINYRNFTAESKSSISRGKKMRSLMGKDASFSRWSNLSQRGELLILLEKKLKLGH